MALYSDLMAWMKSEEGQGMAEYALIIALVAIALIVAFTGLREGISTTFSQVSSGLAGS